ncbi:hypothetical protein [Streptosporangium lutulentum]|uniref:Uncharacterized protein n=1 Tax=Streptosporangium lutulentum TaxID=1461250 RepID=A0ABT9QV86_9ACTN|nr:hypothetical protein [Streptosporangium lutulentum]MDP9850340.1 hypothetical protein [Streptosporangium lutulentum]
MFRHIATRCDETIGGGRNNERGGAARNEYDKLERNATAMTTVLPALTMAAQRWMKPMHAPLKEKLQRELDEAREAAGELPCYFNTVEQSQVILAMDSARARRRRSGDPKP